MTYHIPVLLQESIAGLNLSPSGTYIDATFGGGGHSRTILNALDKKGHLYAFDQDEDAVRNDINDRRFLLIPHNYSFLKNYTEYLDINSVDGIIADLGISSHQVDMAERGFSYRYDAPLDMRMDKTNPISAYELLNESTEEELRNIFSNYGEITNSNTLAREVVLARTILGMRTTAHLMAVAEKVLPHNLPLKKYLGQVFQAIRIAVNDEINNLQKFLLQSLDVLNPGGRLVVITYHSLEDRPVKDFFSSGNFLGLKHKDLHGNDNNPWKVITKKPLIPTDEEINFNPRARSAKLRIAEKK
ncbi:MAG: 16S rRNA (cytosine(1402)-N(4))-methyltransferase RsmH [Bacteroidetes bacterium]|nr:16S rRNA (cytosine(1402)-N(4))-methyltransferase RsmH [Bacteroidota bacterium]